ncbi:MAG TPA: RNA methyltransferase, partial [Cryomorphaceae bacterium]|nr:RNA methyltransferase [Cryomorphaceae bacterium]
KTPVWIILENVRSAHNVGSFFRTADAFGCAGISLCGYTAQPPHKQVDKVA